MIGIGEGDVLPCGIPVQKLGERIREKGIPDPPESDEQREQGIVEKGIPSEQEGKAFPERTALFAFSKASQRRIAHAVSLSLAFLAIFSFLILSPSISSL